MKAHIRLGALLLLCAPHVSALAEGSRELTPNRTGTTADLTAASNTRAGYLIHDFNNIVNGQYQSQGFLKPTGAVTGRALPFAVADYRLKVRIKPGETLFYGVHRMASDVGSGNQNNLILTIKYDNAGTETQATQTTLPFSTAAGNTRRSLLAAGPGVIDNAAQALAGPAIAGTTSATTGYSPLTYTNTTGVERDFWVEFTQTGEANMTQTQKVSQYDFWDFTVRTTADASGREVKGRLHSKFWAFATGNFTNKLSAEFNLFPLVESVRQAKAYYVKQVELAGMNPYAFYFVTNSKGTERNSTDFLTSRKSQTTEKTYPEYENFVNDPDPAIWPSAPYPVFSRTVQPFCNPINNNGSAAFTTTSEEAGSTSVLIDINNNGVQDGADVVIEQSVTANVPATVFWNGRDLNNNPVAAGTPLRLTFVSNGAPVNFPLFDVEGNTDGLRVQNVRPSNGGDAFYDRLYWDDRNIGTTRFPATRPAPDGSNYRPDGVISTPGVHRWTGSNTGQGGDGYTINTWTYGFISAAAEQTFAFNFSCDFDGDGIPDKDDKDDDNDGIPDLAESYEVNPQSQTANGQPVQGGGGNGVLVYLDASYIIADGNRAWRDVNADGINDNFDIDLDGIPNHFDADSDGDGITDAIEANSGVAPSNYSSGSSRITGTVGNNGMPNSAESNDGNSPTTTFADLDSDNDGIKNRMDLDSDNDGLLDNLEAQATDRYKAPSGLDTDKDGLDNAYDTTPGTNQTSGTLIVISNKDTDGIVDMLDSDSDNDNVGKSNLPVYQQTGDWTEGFDVNGNGKAGDEILAKARQFAINNPSKAGYYVVTTNATGFGGTTRSTFLQDANSNGIPNFLEVGNTHYHDDNFNGLVDIYDPAYGGAPSTAPKAANGEYYFRNSAVQVPLPVTLVSFEAHAAGRDALVTWATAQEVNSANFLVEGSVDGVEFRTLGTVQGQGTTTKRTEYRFIDKGAGAQAGIRYYRLRQNDLDGKFAYSMVSTVVFDGKGKDTAAVLYPNPTSNSTSLTLDLRGLPSGTYTVEILGAEGRKVASLQAQGSQESLLPAQALSKGMYMVRISGNGIHQLIKLVKE